MLDGRVLGASQVEYKPFGKPPLKREIQHKCHLCSFLLELSAVGDSTFYCGQRGPDLLRHSAACTPSR